MLPVYKLEEALAAFRAGLYPTCSVGYPTSAASKGDLSGVGHCEGSSLLPQSCREVCSVKCCLGNSVTTSAYSSLGFRSPETAGGSCLLGLRCSWAPPGVSFSAAMSAWGSCASKMLRELCRQQPVCTRFPQHGKIHTKNQCLPEPAWCSKPGCWRCVWVLCCCKMWSNCILSSAFLSVPAIFDVRNLQLTTETFCHQMQNTMAKMLPPEE